MTEKKSLYQTLEDRGNPEEIRNNAPFLCRRKTAWLGKGYYFWDTFIKNAHWWGRTSYREHNYVICRVSCDFDNKRCLDLVGNTSHMLDFEKVFKILKEHGMVTKETTVARVLEFLKQKTDFSYEAIRVLGINSISDKNNKDTYRLKFRESHRQYLDYKPPIQICVFQRKGLNLRNATIEYPDEYNYYLT